MICFLLVRVFRTAQILHNVNHYRRIHIALYRSALFRFQIPWILFVYCCKYRDTFLSFGKNKPFDFGRKFHLQQPEPRDRNCIWSMQAKDDHQSVSQIPIFIRENCIWNKEVNLMSLHSVYIRLITRKRAANERATNLERIRERSRTFCHLTCVYSNLKHTMVGFYFGSIVEIMRPFHEQRMDHLYSQICSMSDCTFSSGFIENIIHFDRSVSAWLTECFISNRATWSELWKSYSIYTNSFD